MVQVYISYPEKEEEQNQELIEKSVEFIRNILPQTMENLSKIPDPRDITKVKHGVTVLLLYGVLNFIYQVSSRREANREITKPIIFENLEHMFPDLKTMPHADTLNRLLKDLDNVSLIEDEIFNIINRFIRMKKFVNLLIQKQFTIIIDGTCKFSRDKRWAKECLEKKVGKAIEGEDEKKKYYCYAV